MTAACRKAAVLFRPLIWTSVAGECSRSLTGVKHRCIASQLHRMQARPNVHPATAATAKHLPGLRQTRLRSNQRTKRRNTEFYCEPRSRWHRF